MLSIPVKQLAPILLKLAHEPRQDGAFMPSAVCPVIVSEGYPGSKKGEVETHLTRCWNWIERKGLIEPSPGKNGQIGWRMFTDEGEVIAKGADIEAIQAVQDIPTAHLHDAIVTKCQGRFRSAHYAQAVELSFKVVRDRLRQLTNYETGSEAFGKGKLPALPCVSSPHQ